VAVAVADHTLRSETGGVRPDFEHEETVTWPAAVSAGSGGSRRVGQAKSLKVRLFTLEWPNTFESEVFKIEDAWRATAGGILPMNYTPVGLTDADQIEVEFVEGSLSVRKLNAVLYSISVQVMEVR
jgi:hypothetical protein